MAAKPEVLTTIIADKNAVPKPKWGYKASRMYKTSTNSGRHQCLLNIQDGQQ